MTPDDELREPLRRVLGGLARRTHPAAQFDELVEHDVARPARAPFTARTSIAVALVASILAIAVGVWRVGGSDAPPAVAPSADRWIAVPLYRPEGMRLVSTTMSVGRQTSLANQFPTTDASVAVVSFERDGGALYVASTADPSAAPLSLPAPDPTVTGYRATRVDSTTTVITTAHGFVAAVSAVGLSPEEVTAVVRSMWFVTPEIYGELTSTGGYRPNTSELLDAVEAAGPDGELALGVFGSLQTGLSLYVPELSVGIAGSVPDCWVAVVSPLGSEWDALLVSGPDVALPGAVVHPGVPTAQLVRFRVPRADEEPAPTMCEELLLRRGAP